MEDLITIICILLWTAFVTMHGIDILMESRDPHNMVNHIAIRQAYFRLGGSFIVISSVILLILFRKEIFFYLLVIGTLVQIKGMFFPPTYKS